MFAAGMHVPLRDPALVPRIRRGALAVLVTASMASGPRRGGPSRPCWSSGDLRGRARSGSAAVLVPCLEEFGLLDDANALVVAAQVALADIASIVACLSCFGPRAGEALLGIVLVTIAGCALLRAAAPPWARPGFNGFASARRSANGHSTASVAARALRSEWVAVEPTPAS